MEAESDEESASERLEHEDMPSLPNIKTDMHIRRRSRPPAPSYAATHAFVWVLKFIGVALFAFAAIVVTLALLADVTPGGPVYTVGAIVIAAFLVFHGVLAVAIGELLHSQVATSENTYRAAESLADMSSTLSRIAGRLED